MSNLTAEIQEAIRKSLPSQTAAELKEYLDNAANTEVKLKDTLSCLTQANETILKHEAELKDLRALKDREAALIAKERILQQGLSDLDHRVMMNDLRNECERRMTQFATDTLKIVFKSQPVGYAFERVSNRSSQSPDTKMGYGTLETRVNDFEKTTQKELEE